MQWKGPFSILATVDANDYSTNVNERENIFHANLLKTYITRDTANDEMVMALFRGGTQYAVKFFNTCATTALSSTPCYEADLCDELEEMENLGIIRKSNFPYASPVVVVKKRDGSYRIYIDYRWLNKLIMFDPYLKISPAGVFQGRRMTGTSLRYI
ncbi:Pol polyprotein [Plakobranchus ocellatus]|uniref:Pol polyprotein n=1 Tax=Plakobranchus ocellatus TaxID=259542 RepID=A0AAV4AG50_9GAST|nr:Pol polyprotein [Plakobranchus ocellatus]